MAIEKLFNRYLKKFDSMIHNSCNGSASGGGPSANSNVIFHYCGKKGHFQREFRSKGNSYEK